MIDTTHELIEKARNGDLSAFRKIIDLYSSRINAITYRVAGNAEDAQDIAQEVFIKLFRLLDTYDSKSRFMTWLYRLTINQAIDYQRKNKRHRHVTINELEETMIVEDKQPGPDKSIEQKELQGVISRLAGKLSEKQQKVFILRDVEEFSTAEIAEILTCSQITVRVHLAKARMKIKNTLIKHYPGLLNAKNY